MFTKGSCLKIGHYACLSLLIFAALLMLPGVVAAAFGPGDQPAGPDTSVNKEVFNMAPNSELMHSLIVNEEFSESQPSANIIIIPAAEGEEDYAGTYCHEMPASVETAFNHAARMWERVIQSSVDIYVRACWFESSRQSTGYAGGWKYHKNFTNAPYHNTYFTGSLANSLAGTNLSPGEYDMHISINRNISWYLGLDAAPPADEYDLVTAVMRKIGHGLNLSGTMRYEGGVAGYGLGDGHPSVYDAYMVDRYGKFLTDPGAYANPSTALGSALKSDNLWWNGSHGRTANGGNYVKIYAPSRWAFGDSYRHLDYESFRETGNRLMTHSLESGDAVHDPGPVVRGMLKDMGWNVRGLPDVSLARVNNLYPVSHAEAGQTARLWAEVENITTFTLPDEAQVWFYVQGPQWFYPWVGSESLAGMTAQSSDWFSIDWDIPSTALPGTYTYWARVYVDDMPVSDFSPAQSFTVHGTTTGFRAHVTDLGPVTGAIVGRSSLLQAEVYNTGQLALPDNSYVWFYVTGPGITENYVGSVSTAGHTAGQIKNYGLNWIIPESAGPGTYEYWAGVYVGNEMISGWSQGKQFNVTARGETVSASVDVYFPGRAVAGRSNNLWAWVTNTGSVPMPQDARLYFYVQYPNGAGDYKGYASIADLERATTRTFGLNWLIPFTYPQGTYTYYVRAYRGITPISDWSRGRSFHIEASSEYAEFEQRFTSEPWNWLQDSGDWGFVEYNFWHTLGREGRANISTYNNNYSDVNFATRMWREGNNDDFNIIIIRASGDILSYGYPSNGYAFHYTRSGHFSVFKFVNGEFYVLQPFTYSPAIAEGSAWNELRVIAVGRNLYFYINDDLIWSGRDSSLSNGRVGLGMFTEVDPAANGLWVDWATLSIPYSAPSSEVSPEQQELNDEALEDYLDN